MCSFPGKGPGTRGEFIFCQMQTLIIDVQYSVFEVCHHTTTGLLELLSFSGGRYSIEHLPTQRTLPVLSAEFSRGFNSAVMCPEALAHHFNALFLCLCVYVCVCLLTCECISEATPTLVNAAVHKRTSLSLSHDSNLRNARPVTWDSRLKEISFTPAPPRLPPPQTMLKSTHFYFTLGVLRHLQKEYIHVALY